MYVIRTATDWN